MIYSKKIKKLNIKTNPYINKIISDNYVDEVSYIENNSKVNINFIFFTDLKNKNFEISEDNTLQKKEAKSTKKKAPKKKKSVLKKKKNETKTKTKNYRENEENNVSPIKDIKNKKFVWWQK